MSYTPEEIVAAVPLLSHSAALELENVLLKQKVAALELVARGEYDPGGKPYPKVEDET